MSRHDLSKTLRQMLDHAEEAVSLCEGKVREDLDQDRLLNLALVRLLEIIGEGANRIPTSYQLEHPQVAWLQIISLRNRLIHGYDQVDFNILWLVIKKDLPALISAIRTINY